MKFYETFGIKKGDILCIAGAGGKTSLMLHLASELKASGYSVLVTTTTRLAAGEVSGDFDFLVNINGEKADAPDITDIKNAEHDVILIEADGSACKPLKGWREDEPVIPDFATVTIGVVDISTVGSSPEIHRPELFKKLTGCTSDITLDAVAKIINSDKGIFRNSAHTRNIVFLSKTESESDIKNCKKLSSMTSAKVTYGSVLNKTINRAPELTAVIMAAGASSRMGENKLIMPLNGKPIINHLLDSFPSGLFSETVLIYSSEEVAKTAGKEWLKLIETHAGQDKNITIKLGTKRCADSDGIMFFVADQPFLSADTIKKITDEFRDGASEIIIPICGGKQRNPVIFPHSTYNELMSLKGDRGGRDVINAHPELCRYIKFTDEKEFVDIDTRDDYEKHI